MLQNIEKKEKLSIHQNITQGSGLLKPTIPATALVHGTVVEVPWVGTVVKIIGFNQP